MSIPIPTLYHPSHALSEGQMWVGTIVLNDETVKAIVNDTTDLGKSNGAYRYAVRLDYIQDKVPDNQLDFYDAPSVNGSVPYYRDGDRVIVTNIRGNLRILPGNYVVTPGSNAQVRKNDKDAPLSQQNGAGNPKGVDNTEQGKTRDVSTLANRDKYETQTAIQGACSDKTEFDGISTALKNFIGTVNNIKSYTTTYLAAATKIVGDVESEIKKTASIIAAFIQTLFSRIRSYIINKINAGIHDALNFLQPHDKRIANDAKKKSLDTICCIFDKLLNKVVPIIENFLKDVVNRFVSAPMCAVESAVGSLLADVSSDIGNGINTALAPVKSALGSITSVVGNIFEVADFVTSVLGFFTCDSGKPLCPGVKQWGWLDGPNPQDATNFSNVVTNFNLSGGTSKLLGDVTSSGLGTAPGSLGYALGLGTGPSPTAAPCNIGPVLCGPPSVSFFGGGGSGAAGNVIISATGSILGVDVTSKGSTYKAPPFISFVDPCGSGSGASAYAELDAAGAISGVFVKSSGSGYKSSTSSSSSGGGGSTLVPTGHSAVSVPPVSAVPSTTSLSSSSFLDGHKLSVSPKSITEGPGTPLVITLVPPASTPAGKKYQYKLTSSTGSAESSVSKFLGKTLEFEAVKVDAAGVVSIEPARVFTSTDTIYEGTEIVTIEVIEVPGLKVTVEIENEILSSYTSYAPGTSDYTYFVVSPSITVKEGETAKIKVRRLASVIDSESKIDYKITTGEARYGSGDPKVALEGTHFLYPKVGGASSPSATGTITFAAKQTEIEIPIITLSSVGTYVPGIDSREINFELVKNKSSTTVDEISKSNTLIVINERKLPEKDSGVPLYQAPLITRIKALEVTGLFDPGAGRVVEFRTSGTIPGEIYIGSLKEVKLFLSELKALKPPYSVEAVENVERLQVLALDAVINKYEESVRGGVVVAGVVASLEFVTDVWEFYDFFKDTGTAALRNEYVTKDGRKGFVLEDRFTQSAYKTTKENIPIFWQLKNLINDDIDYYAITMRSPEATYAGSPTIYWDVKYIDPDAVKSEIPAGSRRIKGDIPITVGNAIHTKLDTFPGYRTPVTSGSTVIGKVAPLPAGTEPAYSFVGYVAPELPSRIPGYSSADASKTYKYEITVYAYIKPGLGGGFIYNTLEFFVEG